MITADKLFYLLDALNISMSEFESTRAELARLSEENFVFGRQVGQAFWNKNIAKLQHLLTEAENKLTKAPDDKRLQINVIDIKACLHRLNPTYPVSKLEISRLFSYLMSQNEWALYEIRLFSNTVEIFEDMQIRQLVSQMIEPKSHYFSDRNRQREINLALLNTISHFIETEHFTPIYDWFDYLESHIHSDLDMYSRAGLEYHKALLAFCQAPKIPENLAKVEKAIAAFSQLACFNLVNIMTDELTRYKKKYHI